MNINKLTEKVIGCAIEVHKVLGPGLLESSYEQCLAKELSLTSIDFEIQKSLPVEYKGIYLDCGYKIDIFVEKCLILELKSVEKITDVHKAQILTYMKLAKIKVGLLINFNVKLLTHGIQRFSL
ncbi:MAG: GxxExxY protein [Candidatus Omnitrophota bacterium]